MPALLVAGIMLGFFAGVSLPNSTFGISHTILVVGMAFTLKRFFEPKATIRYPEVRADVTPKFRGRLQLPRLQNGRAVVFGREVDLFRADGPAVADPCAYPARSGDGGSGVDVGYPGHFTHEARPETWALAMSDCPAAYSKLRSSPMFPSIR